MFVVFDSVCDEGEFCMFGLTYVLLGLRLPAWDHIWLPQITITQATHYASVNPCVECHHASVLLHAMHADTKMDNMSLEQKHTVHGVYAV